MTALPVIPVETTPESREHWEALADGRFVVPWCDACDGHVWPPRSHCVRCLQPVGAAHTLAGTGTVYTLSRIHRAARGFEDAGPYVIAYVQLDGGPMVLGNLVYPEDRTPSIDDRVTLAPGAGHGGVGAARFQPAG